MIFGRQQVRALDRHGLFQDQSVVST